MSQGSISSLPSSNSQNLPISQAATLPFEPLRRRSNDDDDDEITDDEPIGLPVVPFCDHLNRYFLKVKLIERYLNVSFMVQIPPKWEGMFKI